MRPHWYGDCGVYRRKESPSKWVGLGMDIISGLVVVTGAFLVGAAFLAGMASRTAPHNPGNVWEGFLPGRTTLGTMVVVYFVATTHILLIAQQPGLAAANLALGLVLVFVQFVEPAVRAGRRQPEKADEAENWRR